MRCARPKGDVVRAEDIAALDGQRVLLRGVIQERPTGVDDGRGCAVILSDQSHVWLDYACQNAMVTPFMGEEIELKGLITATAPPARPGTGQWLEEPHLVDYARPRRVADKKPWETRKRPPMKETTGPPED